MELKTYGDLIEWTRQLHTQMAKSLKQCSGHHPDERASLLLDYISGHEADIAKMLTEFEEQADKKAMATYIYDYLPHKPPPAHLVCGEPFAQLDSDEICKRVFSFHKQVLDLYQNLVDRAEVAETRDLAKALLEMEEHHTRRLSSQTGRMRDI